MIDDILEELKQSNDGTLEGLGRELAKLRTGRANVAMLDGVRVDYYGQMVPINQVANMKVADARLITIQPWEKAMIGPLERAIGSSDLGLNPSNDGTLIRVPVPALTGERRKDLVRMAKRIGEDHKISLRNARRDANETLKAFQKDSEITEDDLHRGSAQVNKITESYTKAIDEYLDKKESEILEI